MSVPRRMNSRCCHPGPAGRAPCAAADPPRGREHAGALPDADALHQRIAAAPDDLQARLDLAQQYIALQDYEAALEQLLAIVERDRAFRDDIGRKTMVSVFDLMRDPQAVSLWRRQLASRLN